MPGRLLDLGQFLVEQLAIEQLAGVGILEVLILDPGIGIVDVAVEQVLAVIGVGFQIGLLDLVADELGIARRQLGLDEFEIALLDLVRQLLAPDRLLEHVHQMHRIGADLGRIVVEGRGQDLEGEAGRDAVHAFVDAGRVLVFLHAARLRIGSPSGSRRHRPASWRTASSSRACAGATAPRSAPASPASPARKARRRARSPGSASRRSSALR